MQLMPLNDLQVVSKMGKVSCVWSQLILLPMLTFSFAVVVFFKATGGAMPLTKTKFKLDAQKPFSHVAEFLRNQLKTNSVVLSGLR